MLNLSNFSVNFYSFKGFSYDTLNDFYIRDGLSSIFSLSI